MTQVNNAPYWLVAVTGMTPQVITETLYALHKQGRAMPERIILLTTQQGKRRAGLELLVNQRLLNFCQDYRLTPPLFSEEDIWVAPTADGSLVDDVKNADDYDAMADFITTKIRELTSGDIALHASIAGGGKAMTFYLGYAMSLFGRIQDELSHVLINEPYEAVWDFYYPTPYNKVVYDRGREPLDALLAEVTLISIPFVRLKEQLPSGCLDQVSSFKSVVDMLNQGTKLTEEPYIEFRIDGYGLKLHGQSVKMSAINWLFYRLLCLSGGIENVNCY